MYHELLDYLANDWSWDRSVLDSSGIKSYIVSCCNKIYDLINPNGDELWQYAYSRLYFKFLPSIIFYTIQPWPESNLNRIS